MDQENIKNHITRNSPFRMPVVLKITGRSSTITNVFVSSIIPVIYPSDEEINTALEILGMEPDKVTCAYCGDVATEWDHLHPIVKNRRPTGYISEIHNLVPSCGKCNQSKGNKEWQDWMESNAELSPKRRGISLLESRKRHLLDYEKWGSCLKIDFESIVDDKSWKEHWENCEKLQELMRESQKNVEKIKAEIEERYRSLT